MTLPPLVEPAAELSREEVNRYSRHLLIPDIGVLGQRRLKNARVMVIGAGGLGSPTLLYLAAAGIGTLGVIDFDRVDESNLQRQVIHSVDTLGELKAGWLARPLPASTRWSRCTPIPNALRRTWPWSCSAATT